MGSRIRKWPTKGQAVAMGIITLLWLASNWVSVLYEGRATTGFYWSVQVLNVILMVVSVGLYVRAAKHSSKPMQ